MTSADSLVKGIGSKFRNLASTSVFNTVNQFPTDITSHDCLFDRHAERTPTFRFASICSESGELLVDATIRETSSQGAQLRLKSAINLPDRIIVRTQPDQTDYAATVKWVSGASIGIKFDEDIAAPKSLPTEVERNRVIQAHLFGNT